MLVQIQYTGFIFIWDKNVMYTGVFLQHYWNVFVCINESILVSLKDIALVQMIKGQDERKKTSVDYYLELLTRFFPDYRFIWWILFYMVSI